MVHSRLHRSNLRPVTSHLVQGVELSAGHTGKGRTGDHGRADSADSPADMCECKEGAGQAADVAQNEYGVPYLDYKAGSSSGSDGASDDKPPADDNLYFGSRPQTI